MKDKKGFTLVELLITITLMLLILILAIINFNKVSKDKKEDSWKLVEKEIEDAAKKYFVNNEYLFEGLINGSNGTISVGKLVEEDYLGKVIDPITGKAISKCAIVNVTKVKNKYDVKFDESSKYSENTNCDTNNSIIMIEPGGPTAMVKAKYNNREYNNFPSWLNVNHKDPSVVVYPKTNGNGPIISTIIGNITGTEYNITDETNEKTLNIIVTNSSGKKYMTLISYRRDVTLPDGNVSIKSKDTWPSKNVKLNFDVNDNLSGIEFVKIGNTNYLENENVGKLKWSKNNVDYSFANNIKYDGSIKKISVKMKDKAGNENTISNQYTLYNDCEEQNRISDGNWYNKSNATCSNKCGKGKILQESNTIDKNSKNSCSNKTTRYSDCGGTTTQYGSWSEYGKCESGKKTRTRTVKKISTYDGSVCSSDTEKDTKNCTTCEITKSKDIYGMIDSFDINLGVNVSCNGIGPWTYSDNKTNGEQACAILKTKNNFTLDGFAGAWDSSYKKTDHHINWNNASKNNKTFYKRTGCSAYMSGSSKCDPSQNRYVTVCAVVKIEGSSNCSKKKFTICRGRNYDTGKYSDVKIY